jgi:hypothetical protein
LRTFSDNVSRACWSSLSVEHGLSLLDVRARIKKLQNQVEALKRVPVPPSNIREKVRTYVQGLTRPIVGGIGGVDEALTVADGAARTNGLSWRWLNG